MTDEDRMAEINVELAEVTKAISHLLAGGQMYMLQTGSSMRQFQSADIDKLRSYRGELRAELRELQGESGFVMGAGW